MFKNKKSYLLGGLILLFMFALSVTSAAYGADSTNEAEIKCEDYTYSSCPEECVKQCTSSECSETATGTICTTDCGGPNSCVSPTTCTDSDGGKNYYTKGTIKGTKLSWKQNSTEEKEFIDVDVCGDLNIGDFGQVVDSCGSNANCIVYEYYCQNNTIHYEYAPCPNGCNDGACIENKVCATDVKSCSDGTFVKRNPNNNCEFDPCPITKPDLTISDIYADGNYIVIKISNIGKAEVPADNNGYLDIYIDDQPKQAYSLESLPDQSFRKIGGSALVRPQSFAGQRVVKAVIDPYNKIDESDENNNILTKTISNAVCTDSDGGKNYYEKGKLSGTDINGNQLGLVDVCEAKDVHEYFCQTPNSTGNYYQQQNYNWVNYLCQNGCSDGACIEGRVCTEEAKICADGTAVSRNPGNNCEFDPCPITCTDSDGGKDYYNQGTACENGKCATDFCQDDTFLMENYCSSGGVSGTQYRCPNGCYDGACLPEIADIFVKIPSSFSLVEKQTAKVTNYQEDMKIRLEDIITNSDCQNNTTCRVATPKEHVEVSVHFPRCSADIPTDSNIVVCQNPGTIKKYTLYLGENVEVALGVKLTLTDILSRFGTNKAGFKIDFTKKDNNCVDSDGGKNYYKQGIVKYNLNYDEQYHYTAKDSCSGDTLTEYYCTGDGWAKTKYFNCPNGCQDGACIGGVVCTMEYDPVCGVNGKTYTNKCVAVHQNKVNIAYYGRCKDDNIKKKLYKDAKWGCYDGSENITFSGGGGGAASTPTVTSAETTTSTIISTSSDYIVRAGTIKLIINPCKTVEQWKNQAEKSCQLKCSEDGKCGVRHFSVTKRCGPDEDVVKIKNRAKYIVEDKFAEILVELKELRDIVREQAAQIKYLTSLKEDVEQLSSKVEEAINNFITYGVDDNTQKLGAGERAAVMHSFKSAFGKLPEDEDEFSDAIKIANGRWPSRRNQIVEDSAKEKFKYIYKKDADMNNANDNAAVTVMAYGLRQRAENRKLESERKGIEIFRNIYGHNPATTEEWNTMQAITYSGATR